MTRTSGSAPPKISIVINNYNYGRFLPQAIASVLGQDDEDFEAILIDDGSTDDSLAIARNAASPKLSILEKRNGGQASALNAGFAASSGEWVLFLDADDWLAPDAVSTFRPEFRESIAKIHFPLVTYSEATGRAGAILPGQPLSSGNVIREIASTGNYIWPPTSGNVFSRRALAKIMPIPEEDFRISADLYLCLLAPVHGDVAAIERPLGHYRLHGGNAYHSSHFQVSQRWLHNQGIGPLLCERLVERALRERGIPAVTTPMDQRHNLEIVAIAARFGAVHLEDYGFSWQSLAARWAKYRASSLVTLRSRLLASLVWAIIRFAPARLVVLVMQARIAKARQSQPEIAPASPACH